MRRFRSVDLPELEGPTRAAKPHAVVGVGVGGAGAAEGEAEARVIGEREGLWRGRRAGERTGTGEMKAFIWFRALLIVLCR